MAPLLIVLFRWIHVVTACITLGGVFFMRIVLPIGLRGVNPDLAKPILLRTRRVFKMVVHSAILLFLISGTYNAVMNWHAYTMAGPGVGHGLFGLHLLLGLAVLGILLWLLMRPEPLAEDQKWIAITLALLLLGVAAASTLKYVREHPRSTQPAVNPA